MQGKLIVTEGGRDRVHEICEARTLIGRGPDCDLVLRSPESSPAHCEVLTTETGFRLVDLESLQGTEVNGQFVNQHMLKNGDTIRIGAAKITYLGDSAGALPKPKRPAPAALRELPTDADGRPRRYYRHESPHRAAAQAAKGIAIGVVVLLIGVFIYMMATTQPGKEERARFAAAKELAARGDRSSLQRALKDVDGIPPGYVASSEIDDFKANVEHRLGELLVLEEDEKAKEFHQGVLDQMTGFPEGPLRADFVRGRLDDFRRLFPEHRLGQDLDKLLRTMVGSPAAGTSAPVDEDAYWRTRSAAITEAARLEEWGRALSLIAEAQSDPERGHLAASRLEIPKAILSRSYERWFRKQFDFAVETHLAGRTREARAILERLAGIAIEPFQAEAKSYLERLGQGS